MEKLEKHHRYTHLFERVRMLRLLKSGECSNLGEAEPRLFWATLLGARPREVVCLLQAAGWSPRAAKKQGGRERGRQEELVTPEAWKELEEAMKEGQIAKRSLRLTSS